MAASVPTVGILRKSAGIDSSIRAGLHRAGQHRAKDVCAQDSARRQPDPLPSAITVDLTNVNAIRGPRSMLFLGATCPALVRKRRQPEPYEAQFGTLPMSLFLSSSPSSSSWSPTRDNFRCLSVAH